MLYNVKDSLLRVIEQVPLILNPSTCSLSSVSGLTGESWHINSASGHFLARYSSVEKLQLGVNRRREKAILSHLSARLFAPKVSLYSPPWLIVNWLEGEELPLSELDNAASFAAIAKLLVVLHQHPSVGYRLDLHQQFSHYWQHIDRRRLTPQWLRIQKKFLKTKLPTPLKLAVVHMDVHPGNLLISQAGLRLIDWEYATDADIALELAAFFRANDLEALRQWDFIQNYVAKGGYADVFRLQRQVNRWLPWVDYLMLMWFEVRWQQTHNHQYIVWSQPLRERLFKAV